MTAPRFLQIHSLHSYAAALLNRDDSGLAKRLTYGGVSRTRISSQCLKRHWRLAEDPHALKNLSGYEDSVRSRELVTEKVIAPLQGRFADDIVAALEPEFQKLVYGDKADKGKKSRQTLLLGRPELDWLAREAERLAAEASDASAAKKAVAEWAKTKTYKAMSENSALPGGLVAALFGRMVTSDPAANIDAPVHVAHAFTVHGEESESDYFTAVDDLKRDEDDSGADTIQETELTSGLFYGYVVIDLPALVANCGGDTDLAGRVVDSLVHLIAEVSPGAKLGSTAPYGRAGFMLLEAGDRQPRSLAESFRKPSRPDLDAAVAQLGKQLAKFDHAYATGERRICLNLSDVQLGGLPAGSIAELGQWAQAKVAELADA
ncbi:CRISPR system Cascade subunit CasC [Rhodoblastus acidophilus]|uniref:type I-E CRISPR-associated protein Cas7/Cse4/CasC n=1 Tax=Rhodoblastus acidophilus TaxID=1074 RepID=UPI0022252DA4|nr:type I-E CRISPR-associated protein Cas7/Cse4/CasC [Rhodoblastus acidophilus]MCW2286078.1 CRISPR system Cascade subunit CasC [Rhodoblastus acidophilus]MCW2334972.1 CRISPR system Cascade subunit CasC [Rhodoblastus acidophilus]